MILPNFLNYLYILSSYNDQFVYVNTNGETVTEKNATVIKDLMGISSSSSGGVNINQNYKDGLDQLIVAKNNRYPFGIAMYLGSGTTKPTENDYTLESIIPVTDLPISVLTLSMQSTMNKFMITSLTVQNATDHNITVSEIGLFAGSLSNTAYDWFIGPLMLAREVLDTPVIMEPNDIKTFTMVIK